MDVQIASTSMDTSISHSPNMSPSFLSMVRSPRVVVPISADSSAHLLQDMSSVFPNPGELPNALPNSMHVSIPEFSAPITMNTMDVLRVSPSTLPPTPGLLPSFQSQCDPFAIPSHLDGKIEMDTPSSSGSEPQMPAPPMHTMQSPYTLAPSSLAAALSSIGVSVGRSRAGSSASLGRHVPPISAVGYPSVNGGLPSMDSAGVQFPPANYSNGTRRLESPPESASRQPFMAVGDMLGRCASLWEYPYTD
jgi:hypothetical protein